MAIRKQYLNRQDGYTHRFTIEYHEGSDFWTILCLEHPPDPYGKSAVHNHLLKSGTLCQREGYESRSFEHAEAFAHWWMKRWSIYVRTGTFPMTSESIEVSD